MKHLRIAVSGAVGSGKTTLVKALAARYQLIVLEENMKEIYHALGFWRRERRRAGVARLELEAAYVNLIKAFEHWVNDRSKKYAIHSGFVADRWEADALDFWLKVLGDFANDEATIKLVQNMRKQAALFDFIIMLPLLKPFAEVRNEDGLVRRKSFSLRLMSYLMTEGLIRQCPGARVIYLPNQPQSVEERVAFIEKMIMEKMPRSNRN